MYFLNTQRYKYILLSKILSTFQVKAQGPGFDRKYLIKDGAWWCTVSIPMFRKWRGEDERFKASLNYMRCCLKRKENTQSSQQTKLNTNSLLTFQGLPILLRRASASIPSHSPLSSPPHPSSREMSLHSWKVWLNTVQAEPYATIKTAPH